MKKSCKLCRDNLDSYAHTENSHIWKGEKLGIKRLLTSQTGKTFLKVFIWGKKIQIEKYIKNECDLWIQLKQARKKADSFIFRASLFFSQGFFKIKYFLRKNENLKTLMLTQKVDKTGRTWPPFNRIATCTLVYGKLMKRDKYHISRCSCMHPLHLHRYGNDNF